MIVVLRGGTSDADLVNLHERIRSLGCEPNNLENDGRIVIGISGISSPETRESLKRLRSHPAVEQVLPLDTPVPRIAGSPATVDVGSILFGGPEVILMAGPCTVESEEQLFSAAEAVARAGAKFLRGGAYKPATSPYSFQGLGVAALEMLREAGKRFGLKVVSEVMDPRKVQTVAEHVDLLQIGARNMQNYDLLREVGRSGMPVLLKRGLSAKVEDWLLAAEHVALAGSEKIVLCERGIRTFETATRNTLDLSSVPFVKKSCSLPIVVDPSHGTGRADLVEPMALASIAAGADGLLIEVHPSPSDALKDGAQSLDPAQFSVLAENARRVATAVGRSIGSLVEA